MLTIWIWALKQLHESLKASCCLEIDKLSNIMSTSISVCVCVCVCVRVCACVSECVCD